MRIFIGALLFFSLLVSAYGFVDYGVQGELYDIKERNGDDLIKEKLRDLNKTKIREDLQKKVIAAYKTSVGLPKSLVDKTVTSKDSVRARWDIVDPYGNTIYKKGDFIVSKIPKGLRVELCFVDGDVKKNILDKIIAEFGRECVYMVDNMDSRKFETRYGVRAFPMGGQNIVYLKRFKVESTPTKIIKFEDKITRITLNIERVAMEAGNDR